MVAGPRAALGEAVERAVERAAQLRVPTSVPRPGSCVVGVVFEHLKTKHQQKHYVSM